MLRTVSRRRVVVGVLLAAVVGCQPTGRRPTSLRLPLAPREPPTPVPGGVVLCDPRACDAGPRPQRHVLALSSGGLYGAYTTGFLAGWAKTGTRPEFDTVTGVSTGALIAPFAFLGPEFDHVAMDLYTGVRAEDVFRIRAWVTIPFKDAVASSHPLKKLIESQVTPGLLSRVAAEHRKGRRLYVATTNLRTRRQVVWDMGAIACAEGGAELFRDVLLASCSVPGMLPPVNFAVPGPDGQTISEPHVDGGVTAPLFVPPQVFALAGANPDGVGGNLYAVVAGKLFPDVGPVRRRVLPILGATTESIMYAHCRAELGHLYGQAKLSGMGFHLASLRADFAVNTETLLSIDPGEMQRLYREGERDGLGGPAWEFEPPDMCGPVVEVPRAKHPHK